MKKILANIGLFTILVGINSCEPVVVEAGFKDMINMTIMDYVRDSSDFSYFLQVLEAGGIDKTLSAYNPDKLDYTLFLPTNDAIDRFIQGNDNYSSLSELLADKEFVSVFSRYHAVNGGINADDFPFGALADRTLSGDILTVSFVVEPDTSYYKINNQAPVIDPNIEASNGYIHVINEALIPVTLTTYGWLEQNPGFSIFKTAVDETGLDELLDLNTKEEENTGKEFTLLLEHDSVFQKRGINSFDDLARNISPDQNDFKNATNPLYNFVSYHILTEMRFMDNFAEVNTNYGTYSDIPLNINGLGLDIIINKGKQNFDTIIHQGDTTIVNYIGFYYDESNVLTRSGAIHFIDQIMRQVQPSRQIQTFQFFEEPLIRELSEEPGNYLIEEDAELQRITWSGADLFYVKSSDENHPAWSQDYLYLDGDFRIAYVTNKIVQGNYEVMLRADAFDGDNALVEILIDGKKFGGLVDLSTGGSSSYPFYQYELGTINFLKYDSHIIEVRSFIPGKFSWDYIRFEPY